MARAPSRFDRKKPSLQQQARVLVLCEDSKSSRTYLQDAADYFRAYAEVEISHCGKNDPKGIVEEAVKRQRFFDHVYCAIDRDSDPKFDAALNQAGAHAKVTVIASYPCYEYWLLLRVDQSVRQTGNAAAYRLSRHLTGSPVSGLGSKMGLDATHKWPGETSREWGRTMRMAPEAMARMEKVWQGLGL